MPCVYILFSPTMEKHYIGMATTSAEERLEKHNSGVFEDNFTAKGIPWILCKSISCENNSQALKIEKFIKKMKSKVFIQKIIDDNDILVNSMLDKFKDDL